MQCTNLGGMERASLRLMQQLKLRGHEVRVLSLNSLGPLGPLLAEEKIPAVGIKYRGAGGSLSLLPMAKELRRCTKDAIVMTGHHLLSSGLIWLEDVPIKILCIHFHHAGVKPTWQWKA